MQTATTDAPKPERTMVVIDKEFLAALDAWAAELNARPDAVGKATRSDVVRRILARRLRERSPGELP